MIKWGSARCRALRYVELHLPRCLHTSVYVSNMPVCSPHQPDERSFSSSFRFLSLGMLCTAICGGPPAASASSSLKPCIRSAVVLCPTSVSLLQARARACFTLHVPLFFRRLFQVTVLICIVYCYCTTKIGVPKLGHLSKAPVISSFISVDLHEPQTLVRCKTAMSFCGSFWTS